ncbi:hypothetical protein CROQUDRAFT_129746 [Cronartium quercuum f. sp. fusiforme G11]|uniref:Uncharacterized protein n=1 Tax=Cronartium quercuum f. sp. fusiforme G11 TaxID=708437 RepID=A0A9P6TGY3_9BASI|nr:hypothetical protein CROQUDRAFT_129746 [Cronartium quercuum f. sp. fusiforme G11]
MQHHHHPTPSTSALPAQQRGPIAALRRLANRPPTLLTTHTKNPSKQSNPAQPSPTLDKELLQLPTSLRSTHSSRLSKLGSAPRRSSEDPHSVDQRSFHTAISKAQSYYESAPSPQDQIVDQNQSDPYADNPSLNRDIWPVLPNAFVFATDPSSNSGSPIFLQPNQPRSDWTTALGISVNTQLKSSFNSPAHLSPTPARFKPNVPYHKHSRLIAGKRKHFIHPHKRPSSSYRSSAVYGTYTSLARQEIEQERAGRRRGTQSFSLSSRSSPHSPSSHHHKPLPRKPTEDGRSTTASSHARTHSSASTNQLRKTPTSGFHPSPTHTPFDPRRRFKKKSRGLKSSKRQSTTTTSTKDFSGTNYSSLPSSSLNGTSPVIQAGSGGKAGVQLRYHHAMSISDQPEHTFEQQIAHLQPHLTSPQTSTTSLVLKRLTLPDLVENHPGRIKRSKTHTDHTQPKIPVLEPLHRSRAQSNQPNPSPSPSLSPAANSLQSGSLLHSLARDQYGDQDVSEFELLHPEAGPSNWRERELEAQEERDRTRKRYRNLGKEPDQSNQSSSRRQKIHSSRKRPQPDFRPWEYQITEQLLIQSDRSKTQTPMSQKSDSHYHSIKSTISFESPSEKYRAKLSTSPSSYRLSLQPSILTPGTLSSAASRVGTIVSVFSDWSRGRQTLPPGGHNRQSGSIHDSIPMSHFRSMESMSRALHPTSSNDMAAHLENVDEFGLVFHSTPSVSQSHPPSKSFSEARSQPSSLHKRSRTFKPEPFCRQPNDLTHHDQACLLSPCSPNMTNHSDLSSPIPLSPCLVSDNENESSVATVSSHSWYDATDDVILEEPMIVDVHSKPTSSSQRASLKPEPQPAKGSNAHPIVYEPTPFPSPDSPLCWAHRATAFFSSSPHLAPVAAVPLKPLSRDYPHPSEPGVSPRAKSRQVGHKKTYSSPSTHQHTSTSKLLHTPLLPLPPIERVRTQAIFNPTDDPNFLSHPPHQLKRAWKKSHARVKRALSEPTAPIRSRRSYIRSESGPDEALVSKRKVAITRTAGPEQETSDQSPGRITSPTNEQDDTGSVTELTRSQQEPLSSPSSTSTVGTEPCTGLCALSLVPANAWCFVFGFVAFPLWYIGSFYPSVLPPILPSMVNSGPSLTLISDERREFLMSSRTGGGGPISGWPTRGHMTYDSSGSDNTIMSRLSTTEENRMPNFINRTSHDLRALGGFWSEIAPRVDIELAQAFDGPMWAYQRGKLIYFFLK